MTVSLSDSMSVDYVLARNHLTGTIPHTIRNMRKLFTLSLDGNPMHGNLPEWLGELAELRFLTLGAMTCGCLGLHCTALMPPCYDLAFISTTGLLLAWVLQLRLYEGASLLTQVPQQYAIISTTKCCVMQLLRHHDTLWASSCIWWQPPPPDHHCSSFSAHIQT